MLDSSLDYAWPYCCENFLSTGPPQLQSAVACRRISRSDMACYIKSFMQRCLGDLLLMPLLISHDMLHIYLTFILDMPR